MKFAYLLQDEMGLAYAIALDEEMARLSIKDKNHHTFRMVPLFYSDDTTINRIAGPIPPEYLPKI